MKIIIIIISIVILLSGCIDAENSITGTYKGESVITLNDDGSFITEFKDYSLGGNYKVVNDEVILKYDVFGAIYRLKIVDSGKALQYHDGSRWVKI